MRSRIISAPRRPSAGLSTWMVVSAGMLERAASSSLKPTTLSRCGSGPLQLVVHHDEDVEVYLNGERIFSESGFIVSYTSLPLPDSVLALLRTGANQISVHCHQTVGGQCIDVGLAKGLVLLDGAAVHGHDLLLNGPRE